jgi:hypothetical protein
MFERPTCFLLQKKGFLMPRRSLRLVWIFVVLVGMMFVVQCVSAKQVSDDLLGEFAGVEENGGASPAFRIALENERLVVSSRNETTGVWQPMVDDKGKPIHVRWLTDKDVGEGGPLKGSLPSGVSGIFLEGQGVILHFPEGYQSDNGFIPQTGYLLISGMNVIELQKTK